LALFFAFAVLVGTAVAKCPAKCEARCTHEEGVSQDIRVRNIDLDCVAQKFPSLHVGRGGPHSTRCDCQSTSLWIAKGPDGIIKTKTRTPAYDGRGKRVFDIIPSNKRVRVIVGTLRTINDADCVFVSGVTRPNRDGFNGVWVPVTAFGDQTTQDRILNQQKKWKKAINQWRERPNDLRLAGTLDRYKVRARPIRPKWKRLVINPKAKIAKAAKFFWSYYKGVHNRVPLSMNVPGRGRAGRLGPPCDLCVDGDVFYRIPDITLKRRLYKKNKTPTKHFITFVYGYVTSPGAPEDEPRSWGWMNKALLEKFQADD